MKMEKKKKEMPVSQQWNIEKKLELQKLENNQIQVFFDVIRLV